MLSSQTRRRPLLSPRAALAATLTLLACTLTFAATAAAPPLINYGAAPELRGTGAWLNSPPLTLAALRGKVVLIDFWTYSCINCVRTLPHVARLHRQYKDQGLVVVGVHTPEYPYERELRNVQAATQRFGIQYPVAQDNAYATWKAFDNQYWPAIYLIDRNGNIVFKHAGEGAYADIDAAVRQLLAQAASPPGTQRARD